MITNQAVLYKQYNCWQVEMGKKLITQVNIHPNQNILDVGCGTGELTYLLAEKILPHGQIGAIDPDTERLNIAKENQPQTLRNIKWYNLGVENFNELADESIDIIYSNYAMHWVNEKSKALTKLYDLLKPKGQFIMNCIAQYSEIVCDLENTPEKSNTHAQNKYPLINKNEWISLLEKHNFKILSVQSGNNCVFKHLDDFLIFWEATTHGKFRRKTLKDDHYQFMLKKYPNEIAVFGEETLNVLAVK